MPAQEERDFAHVGTKTASFRAETPYRGPGEPIRVPEGIAGNPDFLACKSFIDCIRNNRRPSADEQSGWNSAVMVALANQAVDTGKPVSFAETAKAA